MSLQVFPVKASRKRGKFDLYNEIKKLLKENEIEEGTTPITGEVIEESNNFSILKKQTPLLILLEITLLLILTMLILIFIKNRWV